jgi:hypothetical protein
VNVAEHAQAMPHGPAELGDPPRILQDVPDVFRGAPVMTEAIQGPAQFESPRANQCRQMRYLRGNRILFFVVGHCGVR